MATKRGSGSGESRSKKVISFKDVEIAFLLDGINGVERLIKGRKNPGAVVKRALRDLKTQGTDVRALEEFVAERFGSTGRGRSVPQVGEERRYKAQQIKNGAPFLRLPLNTLGIKKGRPVRVRFEDGRIVVSPA
jgi:hypothetical protein